MKNFNKQFDELTNKVIKLLNKLSSKILDSKNKYAIKFIIKLVLLVLIYIIAGLIFKFVSLAGRGIINYMDFSGTTILSNIWSIVVYFTFFIFIISTLNKFILEFINGDEKILFRSKKKDNEVKKKIISTSSLVIKTLTVVILIPLFAIDIAFIYLLGLSIGYLFENIYLISIFIGLIGLIIVCTSIIFIIKSLTALNDKRFNKYSKVLIAGSIIVLSSILIFMFETKDYKRINSLTDDFGKSAYVQEYKLNSHSKFYITNNRHNNIKIEYDEDLGSYMDVYVEHYTTSEVNTRVRHTSNNDYLDFNCDLTIEATDINNIYKLVITSIKEKNIYNYNKLKYANITIKVSPEYKDNIILVKGDLFDED